jgi:hypothetical protein
MAHEHRDVTGLVEIRRFSLQSVFTKNSISQTIAPASSITQTVLPTILGIEHSSDPYGSRDALAGSLRIAMRWN